MHIVLRFPALAGGNFVANCLALAEPILNTDYYYAKKRLTGSMVPAQRFGVAMYPVVRSFLHNAHWEYCGWYEMGTRVCGLTLPGGTCEGANIRYKKEDIKEMNNLVDLINQQDHYHSVIIAREPGDNALTDDRYKDQVHVRAVNMNHLSKIRSEITKGPIPTYDVIDGVETIDFDMDSILQPDDFYNELCKVTNYLQIDPIDFDLASRMLSGWMPSLSLINEGHINENKEFFRDKFQLGNLKTKELWSHMIQEEFKSWEDIKTAHLMMNLKHKI